jgi:hypothetical protein
MIEWNDVRHQDVQREFSGGRGVIPATVAVP